MAPKAKGQKMGLGEFLTDTTLGDWADEMEDMPLPSSNRTTSYGGGGGGGFGGGFGSGDRASSFADRGFSQREQLPLPSKPPYTCHLGNLSFDATEGDIQDLFNGCQVTSVRIVEDKLERKPKGFAYVEFATLDGLKRALDLTGTQFQGRNVRVSVAEPQKERSETRVLDDWTRKGPLPPADPPAGGRRPSERGFGGGFQRGMDAGPDTRERGARRAPFDPNDRTSSAKELSWERRGPPEPVVTAPPPKHLDLPAGNESPRERKNSPAFEGRSQDGSRPPRREFQDRPVPIREPTAAEKDTQWRARMRPDVPADQQAPSAGPTSPVPSNPTSPRPAPAAPAAPAQRPRLNLQKRTVSQAEPSPGLASATSDTGKNNPFGAARPVDTLTRDREVEERLRVKTEQQRKEMEEQRAADVKAKADAKAAKEKDRGERFGKARDRANGQAKEGEGEENKTRPPKYEILRRSEGGEEEEGTEAGGEDADAQGRIPGDQNVKPQEIVVDPKSGETNGNETSGQLEEEGWSTVGVGKGKKGRGNAGSRALAS